MDHVLCKLYIVVYVVILELYTTLHQRGVLLLTPDASLYSLLLDNGLVFKGFRSHGC